MSYMKGASASINKTISEIEQLMTGESMGKAGKMRKELREKLRKALKDNALDWFQHGFVGGHKVAAMRFLENEKFPRKIAIEVERNFPVRLTSKKKVSIKLRSKLEKVYADRLKHLK